MQDPLPANVGAVYFAGDLQGVADALLERLRVASFRGLFLGADQLFSGFTGAGCAAAIICIGFDVGDATSPGSGFDRDFRRAFARAPTEWAAAGFDAYRMLATRSAQIVAAGPLGLDEFSESLRAAVTSTPFAGVTGNLVFDAFGDTLRPAIAEFRHNGTGWLRQRPS
jgi:ABC-type branched-subunit amino acid transport system substrate-binding protein